MTLERTNAATRQFLRITRPHSSMTRQRVFVTRLRRVSMRLKFNSRCHLTHPYVHPDGASALSECFTVFEHGGISGMFM
jgi:hypothetical protein